MQSHKLVLLVVGGDMALLLNGQTVATYDPAVQERDAAEVFDRVCDSLPAILGIELDRRDLDVPTDDWTWDDIKQAQGEASFMPDTTHHSYLVQWSIDVDRADVDNAREAAENAMKTFRYGEEAHYFEVTTPSGEVVGVDLDFDITPDGLAEALCQLDAHNDDDQDEPMFLYEVEVLVFDQDDTGTAVDDATVYRAACNAEEAKREAEDFARQSVFTLSQSEFVEAQTPEQVNPEDYR